MPTDPAHVHDEFCAEDSTRYCYPHMTAPSVRRAQIPAVEVALSELKAHQYESGGAQKWHCKCGHEGWYGNSILTHQAEAVLAAAAPVLLSEYQQRIEAAWLAHFVNVDRARVQHLAAAPWFAMCMGCDWDTDFLVTEDEARSAAIEHVFAAVRAALGSTKPEGE